MSRERVERQKSHMQAESDGLKKRIAHSKRAILRRKVARDFPSCSKIEPNITSYSVRPLSHPAETGLLISSGDTDRPRCKGHEP